MKKTFLIFFMISTMFLSLFAYSGGDGTQNNPYQIANLTDLQQLSTTPTDWIAGKYFIQTADIDASDTQNWNNGQGFNPIGDYFEGDLSKRFKGSYNGNGFTINNLFINRPSTGYQGIFGHTYQATISNLGLVNANITGLHAVGGIAGEIWQTTISSCFCVGSITGLSSVGGLVGTHYSSSTIQNCFSSGNVLGTANAIGGLVGMSSSSVINSCYSKGNVNSNNGNMIGGLVGWNTYNSNISNSYSMGNVTGADYVGGFVGHNNDHSIINKCYSTGMVFCIGNYYGGLVGQNDWGATVGSSYWDKETSLIQTSYGGHGKTTIQMNNISTFGNWDFDYVWHLNNNVNSSYPYLMWQLPIQLEWNEQTLHNFGNVYIDGQSSNYEIQIESIGSEPLIIDNIYWKDSNPNFTFSSDFVNQPISQGETAIINVWLQPTITGVMSDSLIIETNAENIPIVKMKFTGTGVYSPPHTPENVQVNIVYPNAEISWNTVNTNLIGNEIDVDGYIIRFNEINDSEHFWFLGFTSQTSFIHHYVAQYSDQMFYQVIAVQDLSEAQRNSLISKNTTREKVSWKEIEQILKN